MDFHRVHVSIYSCVEQTLGDASDVCMYLCEILSDFSDLLDGEETPVEGWDASQVICHSRQVM